MSREERRVVISAIGVFLCLLVNFTNLFGSLTQLVSITQVGINCYVMYLWIEELRSPKRVDYSGAAMGIAIAGMCLLTTLDRFFLHIY
ncbi:MAG: hypothetical protein RI911_273 [Candidatus Parcubacteria bacterium]